MKKEGERMRILVVEDELHLSEKSSLKLILHFKVYLRIMPYNEINERIKEEMRTYGNRDF